MCRDDPKLIWSWALYDRANSAFTTLVTTFVYATYFTKAMAPFEIGYVFYNAFLPMIASPARIGRYGWGFGVCGSGFRGRTERNGSGKFE